MTEHASGTIKGITCYSGKGKPGIPLQSAVLRQGEGMEGDFHIGSDRQLSLISNDAREWMRSQTEQGLCFARFKENLLIDGIPMERFHCGVKLKTGDAVLEISDESKRCHPECRLFSAGRPCRLSGQGVFAKVSRGGIIKVDDTIEFEE